LKNYEDFHRCKPEGVASRDTEEEANQNGSEKERQNREGDAKGEEASRKGNPPIWRTEAAKTGRNGGDTRIATKDDRAGQIASRELI